MGRLFRRAAAAEVPATVISVYEEAAAPSLKIHVDQPSPGSRSLGTGSFSSEGSVQSFVPSPTKRSAPRSRSPSPPPRKCPDSSEEEKLSTTRHRHSLIKILRESSEKAVEKIQQRPVFKRGLSLFLRVADLQMDEEIMTCSDEVLSEDGGDAFYPNFHHVSADPPPGMEKDPLEKWVALDDGDGKHAPIAPYAVRALARTGLSSALDESMWSPDHKTARLLKAGWNACHWQTDGAVQVPDKVDQQQVLVWSGTFKHGLYGSDLPAVRAVGLVHMSPEDMLDLLVDSARVQEYNKLSLGREDVLVLQDDMSEEGGPFGGITKVMKSESRPPLLRKTLQFTSVFHARESQDQSGFNIVTRAVTTPQEQHDDGVSLVLKSEILMGVNMIKRVDGYDDRCLVITVNHIRSPMVPTMIAKRIGLQAAANFIHDLRACC